MGHNPTHARSKAEQDHGRYVLKEQRADRTKSPTDSAIENIAAYLHRRNSAARKLKLLRIMNVAKSSDEGSFKKLANEFFEGATDV